MQSILQYLDVKAFWGLVVWHGDHGQSWARDSLPITKGPCITPSMPKMIMPERHAGAQPGPVERPAD